MDEDIPCLTESDDLIEALLVENVQALYGVDIKGPAGLRRTFV